MMAIAGGGSDVFALAKLMVNEDSAEAQADDQELEAARETQRQQLEQQVDELHKAADDVRTGALVEGGIAGAGGVLSVVGTAAEPIQEHGASGVGAACSKAEKASKFVIELGQSASKLAQPAGALAGTGPEKDAEANAKQHEAAAADAGARVAEAEHHHDRVLDNQDRMLATLESTLQSEGDGNLAIIANA